MMVIDKQMKQRPNIKFLVKFDIKYYKMHELYENIHYF